MFKGGVSPAAFNVYTTVPLTFFSSAPPRRRRAGLDKGRGWCKVYGSPRAMQVGPTRGITVITTPGASAAAVMPEVRRTPGQPRGREARGVKARGAMERNLVFRLPGAARVTNRAAWGSAEQRIELHGAQ